MKLRKEAILSFFTLITTFLNAQYKYPITKKIPVVNIYHGIKITDNYQWLENTSDIEVKTWVEDQNNISTKFLNKISKSMGSKSKLKAFRWNEVDYDNNSLPVENDKVYYKLMYPGKNSPLNIYYAKGTKGRFTSLISANSISKKDRIIFNGLYPSGDDRFLAYGYNRNGSDWKEIKIVGIKKKHFFKETLKELLSPQVNWYGQGFFYIKNTYNPDDISRSFPEIMYHKLDTEQSEDEKIFNVDNENESLRIYGKDNQSAFGIKKSDKSKNKFSYYYLKPKDGKKEFKSLFINIKYDMDFLRVDSDTIIAITNIKNKRQIIKFPITNPKKWTLLTPSYKHAVLTGYEFADNKIITSFQSEKSSIIVITDFKGNLLGETITPEGLSVSKLAYGKKEKKLLFKLSSYSVPPVTCQLDLLDYSFKYLGKTNVVFDASKYKFMRKKITSHDGTKIPVFIVYKDSIRKDGNTPFLLKTYGGYGSIAKPTFDPGIIYFIENGGAFAYVHIRGGGEFGFDWWQAGRKLKKKNGILDFTAAAEYLIKEGYTKAKKIGVMGTSHGGLITAGAIIEKPSLFGAAVINVGALDMLRMERTETGSMYVNINEFGTVKKEEEFKNLLSYSPFHNIKETVNYPSTLVITADNDTRVPPYQSYKFAGKLQNGENQKNPILLWSQSKAGHFGANQYTEIIKETSFIYNFLINELTKNK
ncbi:hypothetical protein CW731_03090 [Polaribacter sp. ALD11]|uniref:prolyl oligopeptidase family serine peptidase n=1 Tax=Polaribacter sp. ALD11 TaxID=2058137 RepID=UPI000C309437|nr:prolyl oligopeptidase family serine peptidase [Polaribacter sp. ALD11]AUC84343.1 hypothetical protein CW731_03090 [Polaribacter sp. ALD11]